MAAALPGPLTQQEFANSSRVSHLTLLRRFGSWRQALEAASLGDRYSGRTVSAKMRSRRSRALTDHEILAEMRRVADVVGRGGVVTRDDITQRSDVLGLGIVMRRFGTFAAAVKAAGLQQSPMANRWTEEDYRDNLRMVAAHLGRDPIQEDMNRPPSKITGDSYRHRFGSWGAALGT